MAKDSKNLESLQDANHAQNSKRDEVLKRMLKMKPQTHQSKKVGSDLAGGENFSDGKESSDISDRNKK